MIEIFKKRFKTGKVSISNPLAEQVPPDFRGLPQIASEQCRNCQTCINICPTEALSFQENWQIASEKCIFCGLCVDECPTKALSHSDQYQLAEKINEKIHQTLGRSAHIRHVDTGSCNGCDWEMTALLNPVYDLQRFGLDFVASPRHADILMVTGPVTRHLEVALKRTYSAAPDPRVVIAVGTCAVSGGVCQGSYAVKGSVDRVLPVDLIIPGCPPRPQALLHGLLKAVNRL